MVSYKQITDVYILFFFSAVTTSVYIDSLALDRLGILQEEVDDVARERETWSSLVEMLPPRPDYG